MVSASEIAALLGAASTIAVILGVPFIYLQMRQNARMVEAANRQSELVARQNRSQVMLSIAEHMTDREFVLQRKAVRDIIAKRQADGWDGFADAVDGFEVRAFAIQYESAALMAKLGLIEEQTLLETLGYLVYVDWLQLAPAMDEFEKLWGRATFPNFRAIALRAAAYWKERAGSAVPGPRPADARVGS